MYLRSGKINMIIDGQFGSTGKGLLASFLANEHIDISVSSTGPNAGHTFYIENKKYVTHLIPVSGIIQKKNTIYLSANSVINVDLLFKEIQEFDIDINRIVIHPRAAIVTSTEKYDKHLVSIGSTKAGTGPARASKILRKNPLVQNCKELNKFIIKELNLHHYLRNNLTILVETGQGVGLGLNYGLSYPYCTNRDVLPADILADLGVHPKYLGSVILSIRSYPIRVGNPVDDNGNEIGYSGPFYDDSKELTWNELNQFPELTTVTKRIRRIATFSLKQFQYVLDKVQPDYIFLNFINYIRDTDKYLFKWIDKINIKCLIGYGPYAEQVRQYEPNMLNMLK